MLVGYLANIQQGRGRSLIFYSSTLISLNDFIFGTVTPTSRDGQSDRKPPLVVR